MSKNDISRKIQKAASAMRNASYAVVFTGAGISVESGIPPFRGPDGLWARHDPVFLDLQYFLSQPKASWELIRKLFYDFMGKAQPNAGHKAIADMEEKGWVRSVITQNIDQLHQHAGSRTVYEYHGGIREMVCLGCAHKHPSETVNLAVLPPQCRFCGGLLKPDFVFFGEGICEDVHRASFQEAERADVMLVVGTTGEIMPACRIPYTAKENGAFIIEVNVEESSLTRKITDCFLPGEAGKILPQLAEAVESLRGT